jgi:alcohol dehydrogenase class IV
MPESFRYVESARTIVFGRGAVEKSADLIGDGYTLLTTRRAAQAAPALTARAGAVVDVPMGLVDDVAAQVREAVRGPRLVALGGGRVVDVAKALSAADPPRTVVAIPTSLSGAEMTGVHRHARGVPDGTPRVRADVVINDPSLSASAGVDALAASSANALAHALTARFSDRASPISRAGAREAMASFVRGWSGSEPDREALALGALLAGWAVDHTGLGPHHALAQTAVRTASVAHAQANAALLPLTAAATRARRPAEFAQLDTDLGVALERLAAELRDRAAADLRPLAADESLLEQAVTDASSRPELARIGPAPDRDEIRTMYRRAGTL